MDVLISLAILFFCAMFLGIIVGMVAEKKGHDFLTWWLFGTFLFIIALPMILLAEPQAGGRNSARKVCPYCQAKFAVSVMKCPECKRTQPNTGTATVNSWERTVGGDDEVAKWAKEKGEEPK